MTETNRLKMDVLDCLKRGFIKSVSSRDKKRFVCLVVDEHGLEYKVLYHTSIKGHKGPRDPLEFISRKLKENLTVIFRPSHVALGEYPAECERLDPWEHLHMLRALEERSMNNARFEEGWTAIDITLRPRH